MATQNTCANCLWWQRIDEERGRCIRYAPAPQDGQRIFSQRPITFQFWKACGEWKKNENQNPPQT